MNVIFRDNSYIIEVFKILVKKYFVTIEVTFSVSNKFYFIYSNVNTYKGVQVSCNFSFCDEWGYFH